MPRFLIVLIGLLAWTKSQAEPDICFLPADPKAVVSFEQTTQAGKQTHRIEVRRLTFFSSEAGKQVTANGTSYYVIYYADSEYGPKILGTLEQGIDPLVRKTGCDLVEIFYLAGAHTHIRERWKITEGTAKKISGEEIDWRDDPRMKQR